MKSLNKRRRKNDVFPHFVDPRTTTVLSRIDRFAAERAVALLFTTAGPLIEGLLLFGFLDGRLALIEELSIAAKYQQTKLSK